jgi:hypothetical protein
MFYWAQGIACRMSLLKEFPLQDISVQQYAVGSWGGILFNWIFLMLLYVLTISFLKRGNQQALFISRALFCGQAIVLFMYVIILIKGVDKNEFVFAQSLFDLPEFSITGFSLIYTFVLFFLFIKKLKIKLTIRNVGFAFLVLLVSFFFLVILEEYDSKTNWHKYPTIKIGGEMIYNEKS